MTETDPRHLPIEETGIVHLGNTPGAQFGIECAGCQYLSGLEFGERHRAHAALMRHLALECPAVETLFTVVTRDINDTGRGDTEQAIDRERMTLGDWRTFVGSPLSAGDVGCQPGSRFRVELVTGEDDVIDSYQTTAD